MHGVYAMLTLQRGAFAQLEMGDAFRCGAESIRQHSIPGYYKNHMQLFHINR